MSLVPGLGDQFLLAAVFHEPRVVKATRSILCAGSSGFLRTAGHGAARLQAEPCTRDADGTGLATEGFGDSRVVSPRSHIFCSCCRRSAVQLIRDLTSANFVKISDSDGVSAC